MQPYIFPYIGYFQLINSVDKFVIYDDVNYIKQGWINRNNILVQNKANLFTIPLKNTSSFVKINETEITQVLYKNWKIGFLKTIEQSYKKAPFFDNCYEIITKITNQEPTNISDYCYHSFKIICEYLSIKTTIEKSSIIYNNNELNAENRIIDICKIEKASDYINPIGGIELYSKENFKAKNINLHFIKSKPIQYTQFKNDFLPNLSIIDVLMFNSPETIKKMLNQYELI